MLKTRRMKLTFIDAPLLALWLGQLIRLGYRWPMLAGMACMKRQLWGKAQQLLTHAALGLQDLKLHRNAWRALAWLAEERGDQDAAASAWKRAAQE